MPEVIDDCYGCIHDEPCDENVMRYCSHCKRFVTDRKRKYYREDLYENRHIVEKEEKEKNDKLSN